MLIVRNPRGNKMVGEAARGDRGQDEAQSGGYEPAVAYVRGEGPGR